MTMRISVNRIDLDDKTLQKPVIKDYGETLVTANSGTAYTVDLTAGNVFEITLTGNVTFTFSNPPASGTAGYFTLILKQDAIGSRTVAWPSSVKWPSGGTVPTISSFKYSPTVFTFKTTDGGATWLGVLGGTNMKTSLGPGLFAWGGNAFGESGLGDTISRSSPVQVGSDTKWSFVSISSRYSIALKVDGTLWTWGRNHYGMLGLGDIINRSSPTQVGSLTTWTAVHAGAAFHALKSDGTLWSWGRNNNGQLGLGDTVNRSSPVQIGSLTTWTKVAGANNHALAIKSDGTLWAWGGASGAPGLGDGVSRSSPVQVGALTTWTAVAIGNQHSLALKSDGTLWAWGGNTPYGPLGLGDVVDRSSPVQVGTDTNWVAISAAISGFASFALKSDGTLWGWGDNRTGRLGLGDTANRSSPSQVGSLTDWAYVATSSAIKSDGTLWKWSSYTGVGDAITRSSPVQVGSLTTWTAIAGSGGPIALN